MRWPLSCRSCRHRSWSGWSGMEQRDGIVDLGAETGMKKHERGSDRLRSGSKPNSIGATHNHAIGRMTHSQGSNSVAQAPALMVSHARAIPGQFRFCRTKILRSSRGWRASTLAPISPDSSPLSSGHEVITTTTSRPRWRRWWPWRSWWRWFRLGRLSRLKC